MWLRSTLPKPPSVAELRIPKLRDYDEDLSQVHDAIIVAGITGRLNRLFFAIAPEGYGRSANAVFNFCS